jgi:DNA ligase 1
MKTCYLCQLAALVLSLSLLALPNRPAHADGVLLAEIAQLSIEPSHYLVSEKLDGVRALWDGHTLRFRSGHPVPAPAWFLAALPDSPLDGELWLARGQFERLSGIVRTLTPNDADWRTLSYQLFELPGAPGSFAQRYAALQGIVAEAKFPQLHCVEQRYVASNAELRAWLERVVAQRGEGLMLHLASASYQTGRSDVLLKLKPTLDAEATVLRQLPGKGKFSGMMGSLEVRADDGVVFRIGTGFKNAERVNPPSIGARITFTYRGLTNTGKPRFASFWRVRVAE